MDKEGVNCTLQIDKMNCASCVKKIEDRLSELPGVLETSVNFASGKAVISYDPDRVGQDQIIGALSSIGYPARPASVKEGKKIDWLFFQTLIAFVLSIPFLLHMFGAPLPAVWQVWLATVVQFGAGYTFYLGTWYGLRSFSANMDTLVALGTTAAYGLSLWTIASEQGEHLYFETSVFLIFFILLGRYLEKRAKNRANKGMRALLQLQPKTATIKEDGKRVEVPIEKVPLQSIVMIKPGERVPVDGVVLSGESFIDEAILTGESIPVHKQEGNQVFAGTVNQEGLLEVRARSVGPETALGHIIRLVEQAQSSKAPIQRVADRVTAYFVPAVLLVALMTLLAWTIITYQFSEGIINAVSVLVIACPCALGLATPTAIMVACGRGAKEGILIKDAAVLEKAQKITQVILDKTGTVTEGKLQVLQSALAIGSDQEQFDQIAAGMVCYSNHPASQAISAFFSKLDVKPLYIENYTAYPGKGIGGKVNGEDHYLGSINFMEALKIDVSEFEGRWKQETGMVVALANSKQCLGYFVLADQLKTGSKEAVKSMKRKGISVFLISGDRKQITESIAKELDVDGYEAEVLPSHKAAAVEKHKSKSDVVAMVGDGVNDAPALAAADIGFAIGGGTDVALESATVVLMRSDLKGILDTIELAEQTFKKIRQNLFFAFGYNILGIPLAAFGFLHPLIAGIAMALSSISVVTNSLLLQRKK